MRSGPVVSIGAGGRTRTGTAVRPTDFKFLQRVLGRYSTKLTTSLKDADFTGAKSVFHGAFRPISPYTILALCVQNMFKHLPGEFPLSNRRRRSKPFLLFRAFSPSGHILFTSCQNYNQTFSSTS